ncbi:putative transcription factor Hap3/NF-YB family [Medicago truncatula]|uniref:Nuclear transcription factor Y protein n=1 Tax=Medicago truncatula TaxID=3880 RepID=I3TAX7_MEDTR|nr:nuclear transcription factor Y subunit B19 [Medicago truncatula]KEH40450.1 nuclear transcription factor Y protein [Medicago truncatula]RHN77859.1 putative transcription factor Hap3/NF-YB family [Medicago truncatula]
MGEEVRMPINHVTRVMQSVLPPDTIITDDAKELMQLCVSKFMDMVTSESFQQANVEHQMIVSADDLLWTMNRLGFEEFVRSLGKDLKQCQ